MKFSVRFSIVLVALVFKVVVGTECTDDEWKTIRANIFEHGKALGVRCASDACSTNCVNAMSALSTLLPDCGDSNINYHQSLIKSVEWCGSDITRKDSTRTAGDECSVPESAVTSIVLEAYNDDRDISVCLPNNCVNSCLILQRTIEDLLPDCFDSSLGVNYKASVRSKIEACRERVSSIASTSRGLSAIPEKRRTPSGGGGGGGDSTTTDTTTTTTSGTSTLTNSGTSTGTVTSNSGGNNNHNSTSDAASASVHVAVAVLAVIGALV